MQYRCLVCQTIFTWNEDKPICPICLSSEKKLKIIKEKEDFQEKKENDIP